MEMYSSEPFGDADKVVATQVAALCWRMRKGIVQILLITSRDSGRWILPKGWPVAKLTLARAAAREAWEEAGVEGKVQDTPLGEFHYHKSVGTDESLHCTVIVHALRVQTLKSRFPETRQRRRTWFHAREAADLVAEPQLQDLLRRIDQAPDLLLGTA